MTERKMEEKQEGTPIRLRNGQEIYVLSKPIGPKGFAIDNLLEEWDKSLRGGSGLKKGNEILEKIVREALSWNLEQEQIDRIFEKGLLGWDKQPEIFNALFGRPKNLPTPA